MIAGQTKGLNKSVAARTAERQFGYCRKPLTKVKICEKMNLKKVKNKKKVK